MRQEQYISANALMTTAAYHGALDAAAGLRPVATANVTLAEFRHWAALVPARACMHFCSADGRSCMYCTVAHELGDTGVHARASCPRRCICIIQP